MATKKDMDLDTAVTLIMGEFNNVRTEIQVFKTEVSTRFDVIETDIQVMKTDIQAIKEDNHYARKELYEINRRLDTIEEQVGHVRGYAKEIDDLRSRVKVLEHTLLSRA